MIANHIHDALAQVGKLQKFILERNRFKGYSGKARILSGATAIVGALVMSGNAYPQGPKAHLVGWTIVLAVGLVINYSALIYWFLFDREVRRNPVMLKPALDALPPLAVGGVLMAAVLDLPQPQLRPMRENDLDVILRIETEAYPYPWSRGIFGDCLRVGYSCWVMELNDSIVGYGVLTTGAGEAHVLNLCVGAA